jgi:hypothetical protein
VYLHGLSTRSQGLHALPVLLGERDFAGDNLNGFAHVRGAEGDGRTVASRANAELAEQPFVAKIGNCN